MRLIRSAVGFFIAMLGSAWSAEHVFLISVDGFRPAAIEQLLAAGEMENFARLQREGAWTHNARTDYDYTYTMPNNISIVTGRLASGEEGHNYTYNGTPSSSATLHSTKGSYISSMFDVAHDHGLSTAVHRSKTKLIILDQSYNEANGAPDITGDDDGTAKLDLTHYDETSQRAATLVTRMVADFTANQFQLAFVHLVDPDRAGHNFRWDDPGYMDSLRRIDSYLGQIMELAENVQPYVGRTTIIVTADHGGAGSSHLTASDPENYVIPFYVWGADVPVGADLYDINLSSRVNPGGGRPTYVDADQPIRNGDAGNLALSLLGLPGIPGSTINTDQSLRVTPAASDVGGASPLVVRLLSSGKTQLRWISEVAGTVQVSGDLSTWNDAPGTWPSEQKSWIDTGAATGSRFFRVVFQ